MDILDFIQLGGGLAFFLYGMHVMSGGLERMAGGRLQTMLKSATSSRFLSLILGIGITVAVQSSSAVTVMLVGLVNSGIMSIGQTVGVIMGSNIGTTLTVWLLTLVGLETDNLFISLLKPENFSLIFALIGILLIMASKSTKRRDIGAILVGFAVLMYGMKLMSGSVSGLADSPAFTSLLLAFENPLLGVATGAIFTAIIQASSASIAILLALSATGEITYAMALPIIMGQNIGTCVTSLISSIGVNKNAKKVAVIHILFNTIGTVIFLIAYLVINRFFDIAFMSLPISEAGIALFHTLFNIITTILLMPFSKLLVKAANAILRDKKDGEMQRTELLDERILATPSIAITECDALTQKMAKIAHETLIESFASVGHYSKAIEENILINEDKLDNYEDKLGTALVKLSSEQLSEHDSLRISKMLHTIGDYERLGDHAVNIMRVSKELYEKKLSFSPAATEEVKVLLAALTEIVNLTSDAYVKNSPEAASVIEPLEQVIDSLVTSMKTRHIKRLQAKECSIELGFILSDLLNNCSRISDHCSNIAVSIIEISHNSFDTHQYLNAIKHGNRNFNENFEIYSEKYRI